MNVIFQKRWQKLSIFLNSLFHVFQKLLNAVTPTAKPSPRKIGSQLAARLNQSAVRTPQTNQSKASPAKRTLSPARPVTQSNQTTSSSKLASAPAVSNTTPNRPLSQSTPRPAPIIQSVKSVASVSQSPSRSTANQLLVSHVGQVNKTTPKQNLIIQTKPQIGQPLKLVTTQGQTLSTRGITFKMVKTPNGNTYLVQEKTPVKPKTAAVPVPKILARPAVNDVKPLVNVLPKPQISTDQNTAAKKQQNVLSTPNATKTVAKSIAVIMSFMRFKRLLYITSDIL